MARKRSSDKLDALDADRVARTVESAGWQLIRQRIERAVALKTDELLGPLDPVQTADVRGMIKGLKLALGVPAILKAEAGGDVDEASGI